MTTGSIGPGTVLAGRYRLEDLLSESEGARFWRATDTVLARSVAIHAVSTEDPRSGALMEAARVSATVPDPHLLRVLDCEDSDGITWVVNEWGDGVSLDLMLQQGTLPPSRAAWLAREVADAIAAGHAAGVAHGRLNPEAVLVTHAGAVKLIGYVVDASLEPPRPPDPLYGTIDDREADVIDLAGILYAGLTGRWPGVSRSAVPRAPHEGRSPLRPRQVRAGVPRTLDAICERVLRKEASMHTMPIETAHEIAAALADYVGDSGLMAPLEASGMHVEPVGPMPRGDQYRAVPPPGSPSAGEDRDQVDSDTGDLESTQLSAAVDPEATALHREPLEGPDSPSPLSSAAVEPAAPPPPFDEVPARPLFAETERRAPAGAADPVSLTTWAQAPRAPETSDSAPPEGDGEFWPFTDPHDSANDVHTGTEGRGWLRTGIVVVVLVLVVVAMVVAFNRGRRDADPPTGSASPSASGSASPVSRPIAISEVSDFDPLGDQAEHPDTVSRVDDGDPATTWRTSTYYNNPALGGLKPGVGVLLDLGQVRDPRSVTLRLKGQPTALQVYAAPAGTTRAPTALDQLQRVGGSDRTPERATITLQKDTRTRYLLVWLTRLPPAPGGYRGEIAEISVRS